MIKLVGKSLDKISVIFDEEIDSTKSHIKVNFEVMKRVILSNQLNHQKRAFLMDSLVRVIVVK